MKRLYDFLVCMVWLFNLGCIGWLLVLKQYQFVVAAILNSALAFHYVKKCFKELIG